MTLQVEIIDEQSKKGAKVINGGALAVLPPKYNQIFSKAVIVPDTVYNLVPPQPDEYFVGNILVITSDKTINASVDASVIIYSAQSADEEWTADNLEYLPIEVARSSRIAIPNMNIRTQSRGAYINVVSSDINVYATLFGYYTLEAT
jgi:hypothetical protein